MNIRPISTIVVLLSFAQFIYAADINGKVTGSSSGDFLSVANVMLDGTNFGTSSDRSGNFSINNVPEGDYTLKVTYVGYSDFEE